MNSLQFYALLMGLTGALIVVPYSARAESKAKAIISSSLKLLPANQRVGVQDYLEVIGFETRGGANHGIVGFNDSFRRENSCFNELSSRFYYDLKQIELDHTLSKIENLSERAYIGNSLSTDTETEKLKSGWLWDKALNFSKGNPVLAMQLIGVCGHDDVNQTELAFPTNSEYLQNRIRNQTVSMKRKYADLIVKAVELTKAKYPDINVEEYAKDMEGRYSSDNISCPNQSMFVPQSLGAEVDIPNDLKKRIAEVQAPNLGAASLPAKYYHTIGAAYTSCFMYRRGVSPIIANALASKAIQTYRSGRLCEKMRGGLDDSLIKVSKNDVQNFVLEVLKDPSKCFVKNNANQLSLNYNGSCKIISVIGTHLFLPDEESAKVDSSVIIRKLEVALSVVDAAYIFEKSNVWEESNQCQGEQINSAVRNFTENFSFSKISRNRRKFARACQDLPLERCENALKKIETYQIDFEWSEAQHKAGRDFAREQCKPEFMKKPIEQLACDAIAETGSNGNSLPVNKSGAR